MTLRWFFKPTHATHKIPSRDTIHTQGKKKTLLTSKRKSCNLTIHQCSNCMQGLLYVRDLPQGFVTPHSCGRPLNKAGLVMCEWASPIVMTVNVAAMSLFVT